MANPKDSLEKIDVCSFMFLACPRISCVLGSRGPCTNCFTSFCDLKVTRGFPAVDEKSQVYMHQGQSSFELTVNHA